MPKSTAAVRTRHHAEMTDDANGDAYVIAATDEDQAYHTSGLSAGVLHGGWTFDAGGAGTGFAIASVADGADSGVDIAVTTTGSHGLAVGDIVSQTGLTDAAYVGHFAVKAIISDTVYEVAAVFTATGTGTVNQAATLNCPVGGDGEYLCLWSLDASPATNNETFDFSLHLGIDHEDKSNGRSKFGAAGDVRSVSNHCILDIAAGDRVSIMIRNQDSAGNITVRNINITLVKL